MSRGAVFFDLGNTVATGLEESARRMLGLRLGLSEKEVKRVGRMVMTLPATNPGDLGAALASALPAHSADAVQEAVRSLWVEQTGCVREVPGATNLMQGLKQGGYHVGVISNTWHPFILGLQRCCRRLWGCVDQWVLSYVAGAKKPAAHLYERAIAGCGLPPSHCWMVGDSYELDVAPALEAGMKAVWLVVRPERERDDLARVLRGDLAKPTWVAADLDALRSFFLG